jgi:hypothetical protein
MITILFDVFTQKYWGKSPVSSCGVPVFRPIVMCDQVSLKCVK